MPHCRRSVVALLLGSATLAQAQPDFVLREALHRQWTHECVTFPLQPAQFEKASALRPLTNDLGEAVTYQLLTGPDDAPRIAFHTDLAPDGTRAFTFAAGGRSESEQTLTIEDAGDVVRIGNGLTGISLTRAPAVGAGPISGFQLSSGRWIGGSQLAAASVTGCTVEITARGPVFAEAVCNMTFGDSGTWRGRFRVYAGEPVVLIHEVVAVDAPATLRLMLSERFAADFLFFRSGDAPYGKNLSWQIEDGLVFDWEPWLRWHASVRRGSTFSLYNDRDPELLSFAACAAGVWVDPQLPFADQAMPPLQVMKDATGLHADLPLKHGQRKWLVGAFARDPVLAVMDDEKTASASPLPYRYLIKFGHFPLDLIKDYVLSWPDTMQRPRLLVTPADVARFAAGVTDPTPYQARVQYYLNNPSALTVYNLDDALPAYLATRDATLGTMLAGQAISLLQGMTDYLVDQDSGLPFGAAPHHQQAIATAAGLADIIYDSPQTTPEQRDRMRALAAFLGYTTARPDYWSEARRYAANPNMTTSVYGYQASLAAFIADHPCARDWARDGMAALKEQLDTWSDDNGGWLEAPHYAMVSYDQILAVLLMGYNAGFNDWLYTDEKVKAVIRWLAQIDSPPDSRLGGYRHRPAVGNTYINEPNGDFGLLAYLFRERDPQFAAEMQWQYQQNKMYGAAGIGGFFPAFAGYRRLLTDPHLPATAPAYGSVLFPETGLVLRDHYPSARETYLHLIHGEHHAHYDDDSGSIVIYGKGRILADDFGYYGRAPEDDHSLLAGATVGRGVMKLRDFVTSPRFDYVAGVKQAWTRQIAMVKGDRPEAPCYFVINDALAAPAAATWRLWLTGATLDVAAQSAVLTGKEDVDLDIFFLRPDDLPLQTETKSRTSGSGMYPNWTWRGMETTQLGLIVSQPRSSGCAVVLYPRLKTTAKPNLAVLAGGKGVQVTHEAGVDYVFLSETPFTWAADDLRFSGLAGMIQLRGDEVVLAMGSGGSVSARGKTVSSDAPLPGHE